MKLDCYLLPDCRIDIEPADRRRDWMDKTSSRFAYRCLPLTIANSHGWVIRCNEGFAARWTGGDRPEDVEVVMDNGGQPKPNGHFGSGILTFRPGAVFRTPPGFNLWVGGPANTFKDGIQALSAVVEADWLPYPFTMNWKFTRPDMTIRFEKREPFCLIFPVQRHLLEKFAPEIRDLASDPELERQHKYAHFKREMPLAIQLLKGKGEITEMYQNWYMQGKMPDDSGSVDDHQTVLELRRFVRRDTGGE